MRMRKPVEPLVWPASVSTRPPGEALSGRGGRCSARGQVSTCTDQPDAGPDVRLSSFISLARELTMRRSHVSLLLTPAPKEHDCD